MNLSLYIYIDYNLITTWRGSSYIFLFFFFWGVGERANEVKSSFSTEGLMKIFFTAIRAHRFAVIYHPVNVIIMRSLLQDWKTHLRHLKTSATSVSDIYLSFFVGFFLKSFKTGYITRKTNLRIYTRLSFDTIQRIYRWMPTSNDGGIPVVSCTRCGPISKEILEIL